MRRSRAKIRWKQPLLTLAALTLLLAFDGSGILRVGLGCAVLHECGHALAYRLLWQRWPEIEVSPFGLCLRLRGLPMTNLQERGSFIVEPSSEVYEGQVVGEIPRGEDMDVNICPEKKQTNTRSATADVYESLTPSRKLTLEESLEFAANDECVEVTPEAVRVRKVVLDAQERFKIAARARRANR